MTEAIEFLHPMTANNNSGSYNKRAMLSKSGSMSTFKLGTGKHLCARTEWHNGGNNALNQPSFGELSITCDTITETDEEDLHERFVEDQDGTDDEIMAGDDEDFNEEEFINFQNKFLYNVTHSTTLAERKEARAREAREQLELEQEEKRRIIFEEKQRQEILKQQQAEQEEALKQQQLLLQQQQKLYQQQQHLQQLQQLHQQSSPSGKGKPRLTSSASSSVRSKKSTTHAKSSFIRTPSVPLLSKPKNMPPPVPLSNSSPNSRYIDVPPHPSSMMVDMAAATSPQSLCSSSSSFVTATPTSSLRSSPFLSSPMLSPKLSSSLSSSSTNSSSYVEGATESANSPHVSYISSGSPPVVGLTLPSSPSQTSPRRMSMFSNILKRGKKRLTTTFSRDTSNSSSSVTSGNDNFDEAPCYVHIYRGNGDESWRVKVNQTTTVKDLYSMLLTTTANSEQSPSLKLYISRSLNNIGNGSPATSLSSSVSSNPPITQNDNVVKPAERQLNEDERILQAQRKWTGPSVFVLKTLGKSAFRQQRPPIAIPTTTSSSLPPIITEGRYSLCSNNSDASDFVVPHSNPVYVSTMVAPIDINSSPLSSPWSSPMTASASPRVNLDFPSFSLDSYNGAGDLDSNPANSPNNTPTMRNIHQFFHQRKTSGDNWKMGQRPKGGVRWISPSDIFLIKKIGQGSFSKVYKGRYMGETVAIKVLKDSEPEQLESFKKEYDILSLTSSPHLIKFYGASKKKKLKMVMEYCQHGSLCNIMTKKRTNISWPLVFKWMHQAVDGINFLHNMVPALVHRDIKSHNLLINSQFDLKVADFGLTKPTELQTNSNLKGTMAYCAPELYSGVSYSSKSDVYSLGIVLWEITNRCITGKYQRPYGDFPEISFDFQIVILTSKQGIRPTMPPLVPEQLEDLIRRCWHQDPEERPTCQQVLLAIESLYDDYSNNTDSWNRLIDHTVPQQE
eukprot:gene7314-8512_t